MSTFFKRNRKQNGYSANPTKDFLTSVSIVVLVILVGLGLFLGGRWLWQEYRQDEIENTATTPSSQTAGQEQSPVVVKPAVSTPEEQPAVEIDIAPAEDITDTGILPEGIAWQTVLAALFIAAAFGLSRQLAHDSQRSR